MTRNFQHRPRGHGKTHAGKEWAKDHQVTATFTGVSLETMSLLSGVRLLDLIPTPQNRDAQRRATLEPGPALDNIWRHYSKMPEPGYDPFAVTRSKLAELAASNPTSLIAPGAWYGPADDDISATRGPGINGILYQPNPSHEGNVFTDGNIKGAPDE